MDLLREVLFETEILEKTSNTVISEHNQDFSNAESKKLCGFIEKTMMDVKYEDVDIVEDKDEKIDNIYSIPQNCTSNENVSPVDHIETSTHTFPIEVDNTNTSSKGFYFDYYLEAFQSMNQLPLENVNDKFRMSLDHDLISAFIKAKHYRPNTVDTFSRPSKFNVFKKDGIFHCPEFNCNYKCDTSRKFR